MSPDSQTGSAVDRVRGFLRNQKKKLDNDLMRKRAMKLVDVLDDLYGSEINCGIQSFWDGHWTAWLGDDMNGRVVEDSALKFDEIAPWLDAMARKHYPNSTYAK